MRKQWCHSVSLLALLAVPVSSTNEWRTFPFDKTATNQIVFSQTGMTIHVDRSTSFSIHPLPKTPRVRKLRAEGFVVGLPKLHRDVLEGTGHDDDFALRIGVVFAGDHRMSWWQRHFAPHWLVDLSSLAPDQGISKIHYFHVAQTLPPGTRRTISEKWHLESTVATQLKAPGPFQFEVSVDETAPVLGIWVQADGDDTASAFDVTLHKLEVETD